MSKPLVQLPALSKLESRSLLGFGLFPDCYAPLVRIAVRVRQRPRVLHSGRMRSQLSQHLVM